MGTLKSTCFILIAILPLFSSQVTNTIPIRLQFTTQHAKILTSFQQELQAFLKNSPEFFNFAANEDFKPLRLNSVNSSFNPENILTVWTAFQIPTASSNNNISQQCRDDSWFYAESLANFAGWALKMYDATGKLPDGIASGHWQTMGHFDQCLKIKTPETDSSPEVTGKYCTVFLVPKAVPSTQSSQDLPKSLFGLLRLLSLFGPPIDPKVHNYTNPAIVGVLPSLAFCLPSSCSAHDIGIAVADSIGSHVLGQTQIVPFTNEDFCTVAGTEREYDTATITVIFCFSLIALLLVLGTAYDGYLQWKGESQADLQTFSRILLSFSVLSNGSKILNTNVSAEGNLACLHGIRFLSMTWVVLGHSWMQARAWPDANYNQTLQDSLLWSFQAILNASVSVDTFFFLSGLLAAYVTLREMDKSNGKLNVPMMYLHRYLRLTPIYAFTLAFVATLIVYLGTGPYWGATVALSDACRNSWWQHLLYINNFFPNDQDNNLCMGVTWYLANDMQMFLVSPVFIYMLWRWQNRGVLFLGVSWIGFVACTMAIVAIEDLPPTQIISRTYDMEKAAQNFNDYYQVPWCRIPPYLVGIFMGFVFHKSRNYDINMKPWVVVTGWSAATAMALAVLYGMCGYLDDTKAPTIPEAVSVLYASLHRTAWAVSLSWVVFACVHGYGGFVNRLLSWSAFVPLSRLTYCTYLIHLNWIQINSYRTRTLFYYTIIDSIMQFLSVLVFSMGLAFIASTCIEAPFLNLEKLLFAPKRQPPKSQLEKVHVNGNTHKGFENGNNQ